MKPAVRLLAPGPLRTERLPNGRRRLLRPLRLVIEGRPFEVPEGFETDFSSWPIFRLCLAALVGFAAWVAPATPGGLVFVALLAVLAASLPAPHWSRIDLAGVVHDALYAWGAWSPGGEPISRREADRVWRLVARSGEHRATWLSAWRGWAGLRVGGWPTWWRYRRLIPALTGPAASSRRAPESPLGVPGSRRSRPGA